MTAHDPNLSPVTTSPDTAPGIAVTRDRRVGARDKAAIIVWRIGDDTNAAVTLDAANSPMTSRLARHLVALYSDMHRTVVDFDADEHLRHTAEATGRTYLALADPAELVTASTPPGAAALMVLRWPRPAETTPAEEANRLLSTCRQHLADDGSTIVVVTAATAAAAGASYVQHKHDLLTAAQAAGLRHVHDIVALDAEGGPDTFTYTTAHDTAAPNRDDTTDTPRQAPGTTLMIFDRPDRQP
ncbi:hypothetical protein [Dactylosporangium salmoneum]|uniref:Uncharacterized protein n=1 Tax=Dactylosporangium salmoneum TaxID=53361 RepID=A0ABN3GEP7_9ACTN